MNKLNIKEIAKKINIQEEELICYGNDKAKIKKLNKEETGNLILVTSINPTPYGEGKTTVSIALADALNKKTIVCLREPSMGPVFGLKGGATGGGMSQVIPSEDINLHFTGDFHAITSANNLLSAAISNHIYQGNELNIEKITFNRCLDINDRALRSIKLSDDITESFDITAASEIMAIFSLANSLEDLKERLRKIIIGYSFDKKIIYAKDLKIENALIAILKDAFLPNLVQTMENTPAIIHGGPFANIAHGCSSVIGIKTAQSLADYVVTEAGFGSDLGAEKFMNIVCKNNKLNPKCIVLVVTVKALKHNGKNNLVDGLENLKAHIDGLNNYNIPIVVAINKFNDDTSDEIEIIKNYCLKLGIEANISDSYNNGSLGSLELANSVIRNINEESKCNFLYNNEETIYEKTNKIAVKIYHAKDVEYSNLANKKIKFLEQNGLDKIPVCIAKTPYSLTDNKEILGYPVNHTIHVKDIKINNGAGFVTVYLENILTMPGLPKEPNYEKFKI